MQKEATDYVRKFTSVFEPALIDEIENNHMVMQPKAGDIMMNPGETIRAVPLVASGTFKVSRVNEEGQELLLYYVKEGESCAMTFTCCMMAHNSVVKGTAEDDSVLLCVPVTVMDTWMTKYPSWKKFVMTTILSRFTEVIKSIDDVAFKKLDERLVSYLKEKSKLSSSSLINLSHQQIADDLGTNRVVISRLLKQLENEKKLLLYRNQIKLLRDM